MSLLVGLAVVHGACGGGDSPTRPSDGGPDGGAEADAVEVPADAAPDMSDALGVDDGGPPDAPGEAHPVSACGVAGSLLVNCSFEQPPASAGGFQNFATGQSIGGWTVTAPGGLSTLSGTFTQNGYSFPAHDGAQSLDMTGYGVNSTPGVSQTVATTAGARYDLTFWVGNLVDVGGIFGTTSTITVYVDGAKIATATNGDGAGAKTLAWKAFTASFTASAATTTIELRNADPANDNSNILDDVSLLPAK
jgi:hypothetical protein